MNKTNEMMNVVYDTTTGAIYKIDSFGNREFIGYFG